MLIDGSCLFSYECKTCTGNWNNDTNVVNIGDCSYIIAFKYIDCYCPSDTCRREMQINSIRSLVPACNTVNSDSLMNFSVRRLLQIAHSVFGVPDPGVSEYKITISNPSCFRRNLDTLLPCEQSECCGRDYTMILEDGEPIVKAIDPDSVAPYDCFGLIGGPCGTHLCSSQMVPINFPLLYTPTCYDSCYISIFGNTNLLEYNFIGTRNAKSLRFRTNDIERLSILSGGNIGINNTNPESMLQIGESIGIEGTYFTGGPKKNFILFNTKLDFAAWPSAILYKSLNDGHSSIIESDYENGSLLLSVSGSYNKNNYVSFFESASGGYSPMGIIIKNTGTGNNSLAQIGLGSQTISNTRVTIRGWTCDENGYALKVLDNNYTTPNNLLTIRNDGKVGIGTDSPREKLEIKGNTKIDGDLEITGEIHFSDFTLDHWTFNENWGLTTSGRVGIGVKKINSGSQYWQNSLLCVYGPIITTELIVAPDYDENWSDFVFDDDYKLIPLDELEITIKEKGHLPGIPNKKEITNNGINILEMQAKLLQKIEELTLYVIELKKENKELQKQINNIKK